MADSVPGAGEGPPAMGDDGPTLTGMPRWVRVLAIIAAVLAVLVVILLISGGHGPGRHMGLAPATFVSAWTGHVPTA